MERKSQKIEGWGGSCREVLGIARFYCRRFAGGVEWSCSVSPDHWPAVGLDRLNSGMSGVCLVVVRANSWQRNFFF